MAASPDLLPTPHFFPVKTKQAFSTVHIFSEGVMASLMLFFGSHLDRTHLPYLAPQLAAGHVGWLLSALMLWFLIKV